MSRMERINRQMQREVSTIIHRDLADPSLKFVTITHVSVSRDLRRARVYFSILGDKSRLKVIVQRLEKASGFIRKLVGHAIVMRYTPQLVFIYDESILTSARIEETLEELRHESEEDT